MKLFLEYFSDPQIIKVLCRARIKSAEQRHEQQYLGRLIGQQRHYVNVDEVGALLPPRKVWRKYRPQNRQFINNVDFISLRNAVYTLRENQPHLPWVIRLNSFIERVRERINDYWIAFSKPEIRWELKGNHKYRAIATFNLEDNVVCGLTAQYLKEFIDPAFEKSSYAFRAPDPQGKVPTYHDAFEKLYDIRRASGSKRLYVAECDIRGFYDCVDHKVALDSLLRVVSQRQQMNDNVKFDIRALRTFEAYLDCYSFPQDVLGSAINRLKQEDPDGIFPWPGDALVKYHQAPLQARIGVPQGGAISCLIANLVLDRADKRVVNFQKRTPGLHYLRYCDDMVLVAATKTECSLAFKEYLKALEDLKLPYHLPKTVKIYNADYWSDGMKSKAPYCWSGKTRISFVPWLQFVGYQIRYDGLVRPKRKSVEKQLNALKETVDKVKSKLVRISRPFPRPYGKPPILVTKSQAIHSVHSKLTCMGVGKVDPNDPKYHPLPMCWANGFKALHDKPIAPNFLKQLDRERERQIRRFNRAAIVYGPGRVSVGGKAWHEPKGYLFSYYAQFRNNGGKQLIANPMTNLKIG